MWASHLQNVVATPALSPYDNPFAAAGLQDFRALLERHAAATARSIAARPESAPARR